MTAIFKNNCTDQRRLKNDSELIAFSIMVTYSNAVRGVGVQN
jgi:hypothetical protein